MTDRQLYHLTIGYNNGQSVQALTYMDREAVHNALAGEVDQFGLVHLSCVGGDGDPIELDVSATNIQLMMHQKYVRPQAQSQQRGGGIVVPRIVQ